MQKSKKMVITIVIIVLVPVLLLGALMYYVGYRGMPVAKTTEEFKAFAKKELNAHTFYEIEERDNGKLIYTLSDEKAGSLGLSWFDTFASKNAASFYVDLKNYGSFWFPVDAESLIKMGWVQDASYYRNSRGEEITLHNSGGSVYLTLQRERKEYEWDGVETYVWPKFDICGINNNTNMDNILKTVGMPFAVTFEPGDNPLASLYYNVFSDGVYQNGNVIIKINTKKNALEMIDLIYYKN